jgi:hypothetical protein
MIIPTPVATPWPKRNELVVSAVLPCTFSKKKGSRNRLPMNIPMLIHIRTFEMVNV